MKLESLFSILVLLNKKELKRICRAWDLPVSGRSEDIIWRICTETQGSWRDYLGELPFSTIRRTLSLLDIDITGLRTKEDLLSFATRSLSRLNWSDLWNDEEEEEEWDDDDEDDEKGEYKEEREEQNYYQILQVDPCAEPEIIEVAYKRLMQKYHHHPDRNPLADATIRTQQINVAYEVLRDHMKRKQYDMVYKV